MAFTSPPPAPQRGDRTTFSNRVDAFLTWLTNLIPQMNVFLSSITTLAAGGANAFSYTFDTATTDGDPGNGKVRLGSATQNTANVIRVDNLAANGGDVTAFLTALQAGTSNIKASVRLQKVGDTSAYLLFDITAIAAASGYLNLTVTPRTSSTASPFAADDTLVLFFDPKGDKGDGGGTPTAQQIRDAIGTLGIANGGTGATTASVALAALGGLPITGGNLTGNLTFNNNTGLFFKDSSGNARQTLVFSSDNNIYASMGPGGFFNFQNAAGTATILSLNNGGNLVPSGGVTMPNNVPLYYKDNAGTVRYLLNLAGDNNVYINIAGGQNLYFTNQAGSAVATLTNAGAFSANTVAETSDERKKTNWRALTDAQLDALADMEKVGVFDWIDGTGSAVGASAQQIQAIVPWAVHETIDQDGNDYLTVAYGGLAFAMAQGALRRAKGAA